MKPKLIVMTGLPGTGKSTVARALGPKLGAIVIDKDIVRAALFAPEAIEYSAEQDDFVVRLMLETAGYLFGRNPARPVILDGRTYSRRYQLEIVEEFARRAGAGLSVIECVCSEASAVARIEADMATHLARNRTPDLYRAQKAAWEGIPEPKCVIDTDQPLEACVAMACSYAANGDIMAP